jgi:hypothetical protein
MSDPTGWFACFERGEDASLNPDYPWRPVLDLNGHMPGLDVWFKTEAECLDFIRTQVIGQPLLDSEQPGTNPGGRSA